MKLSNQVLSVGIAAVAIALVLLLVQNVAAPPSSTTALTGLVAPALRNVFGCTAQKPDTWGWRSR